MFKPHQTRSSYGHRMTSTDTTADQLHAVLTDLAAVVENIAPAQDNGPTPCAEWDVAALRTHVVGWLATFAAGFADSDGQAPRADLKGYIAPEDPAAEIRHRADELDAALRAGAAQRPLQLGEAAMPGELALGMILWEYQVHGWDLATATGQPWEPPAAATRASREFAPSMLTPDYQGEGKAFAPPVTPPADPTPLAQLVALSGRDADWKPPMSRVARGTFDIVMTPGPPEVGAQVDRFDFTKTFVGDLDGTGAGVMLSCGDPGSGSAGYVAMETVHGRIHDKDGEFALQQAGTMHAGEQTLTYEVVPGSGRGGLTGITGAFHLTVDDDGTHRYTLTYHI